MLPSHIKQMRYHPLYKILFFIQNILEKYDRAFQHFQLPIVPYHTAISYCAWQMIIYYHYIRR